MAVTTSGNGPSGAGAAPAPAVGSAPGQLAGAVSPVARATELRKTFWRRDGSRVPALDGVSLDVAPGEFVVLLGPSGCGKTTLLRCLAGLEIPDSGTIQIRGKEVYRKDGERAAVNLPPEERGLSMIFQSYALWPHMTTFENVAYPLRSRGLRGEEVSRRVNEVLDKVGIGTLGKQYASQLSGGQQQRVALARALVPGDPVVLFDEPLSNVDAKVRERLRMEILSMQREFDFAAVYVTHDQLEAMELADRIAVMRDGRIEQIGPPEEIYQRPESLYVAEFIGRANLVDGTVVERNDGTVDVKTPFGVLSSSNVSARVAAGDEVVVVARPEALDVSAARPEGGAGSWQATVEASLYVGAERELIAAAGGERFRVIAPKGESPAVGSQVWLSPRPDGVRILPREAPEAQ